MRVEFFKTGIKLGTVFALLAVTGCAEYHKRVLENTRESGSKFTCALAKEYEELGHFEQVNMFDEYSADYYYLKAIYAKQGLNVGPTHLENWSIEPDKLPELQCARERLVRALRSGAREISPKRTAYAQAHFDCWVEQQDEGWQRDDIAICRSGFYKGMADVELMLMGGIKQTRPAHVVFFPSNSAHLSQEDIRIVDEVAAIEKSMIRLEILSTISNSQKIGRWL
jgi:OOP family OmpA-OmpF porin